MIALAWHNVTPSNSPKFLVTGTELNCAIVPGTLSRFQICELRSYDAERQADRIYAVRDAHTVTDAQVKEGVRPAIVARFATLDLAEEFCLKAAK